MKLYLHAWKFQTAFYVRPAVRNVAAVRRRETDSGGGT
jgi:hypothetical protein